MSNPANEEELLALRVAELRDVCKANGLDHKGLKSALQDRLREHLFKDPSVAGASGAGSETGSVVSGGSVNSREALGKYMGIMYNSFSRLL